MSAWNAVRVAVFAAAVASAAQLATLAWRAGGHRGGYTANEDERFYFTVFGHAARDPLNAPNPFDRAWRDAAPSGVRLLALAVSVPVRLGVPAGATWDAARWLGTAASAALIVAIGGTAATPAVGAAAAVLVLLDPGAFHGKPVASLAGIGVHAPDDPHQLLLSRALVPSLTLPLFLLAVLGTLRLARRRTAHQSNIAAIAAVGLTGHLFTWSSALAGAGTAAVADRRRRHLILVAGVAGVATLVLVALGGLGRHGAPLEDIVLRLGGVRTHRPQLLTHLGFWAGSVVAFGLLAAPWRIRAGARALGAFTLGAWALALLHTPLGGWDIESFHFGHAMGPLVTLTWSVALWHAWRRIGRPRAGAWAGALLVCAVAFAGPVRAMRGLGASLAEGGQRADEARGWLAQGSIPDGAAIVGPGSLQGQLGAVHGGVVFASPYQMLFSVPDSVLFDRAVCGAVLVGDDSAAVVREALRPRPGSIAVWHSGRPADVSLAGIRSYFDLFDVLAGRLGTAVAEAQRSPAALARVCAERPDYALAVGGLHVRRATAAAQALGGTVRWRAADGRAQWTAFPR